MKHRRRYSPFQTCHECGRTYWAGVPRLWFMGRMTDGRKELVLDWTWLPGWSDCCSLSCNEVLLVRELGTARNRTT